ncbi:hypothetical protein PCASD_05087 [Puccinia coronata f. sp. avenae]|uniref:Uncharacterized protein n=1 Tax=Puccinia coronata f. sp. avenae TaxID=200324 RepID=A0A2N5VGC5_9BASI|nr:hypothetical protein PCASD_05087 [Puccinia coronata f. sp. avenae]
MAHEKRYRKPPPFRVFDKPENNHETYIVAKMLLDLHLDYGRCDDPCSACGTLDWKLERNRRDRNKPFTDYPTCCSKGSVKLETGDQGLIFIDGPPGTEMNEQYRNPSTSVAATSSRTQSSSHQPHTSSKPNRNPTSDEDDSSESDSDNKQSSHHLVPHSEAQSQSESNLPWLDPDLA